MDIYIPVLICIGIAALCGVILTLTSHFFGIKEDEKFISIRDCLPGANCGACGYSGCDGYAKALAEGKTDAPNLCVPGGEGAARDIAAILGVEPGQVNVKAKTGEHVGPVGRLEAIEAQAVVLLEPIDATSEN